MILQQIYIRYLRGQTRDERFAILGDRVKALLLRCEDLMARKSVLRTVTPP